MAFASNTSATSSTDVPDPALLEFLGALGPAESAGMDVDALIENRLGSRDAQVLTGAQERSSDDDEAVDDKSENTGDAEQDR